MRLFRRKPVQRTFCYCPGCKLDLVSRDGVVFTDTDLVRYTCPCGVTSEWLFDAPVPLLIRWLRAT